MLTQDKADIEYSMASYSDSIAGYVLFFFLLSFDSFYNLSAENFVLPFPFPEHVSEYNAEACRPVMIVVIHFCAILVMKRENDMIAKDGVLFRHGMIITIHPFLEFGKAEGGVEYHIGDFQIYIFNPSNTTYFLNIKLH